MVAIQSPLSGAIAQLGERLLCKQEVVGSIPSGSTSDFGRCVSLVREFEGFAFGQSARRVVVTS